MYIKPTYNELNYVVILRVLYESVIQSTPAYPDSGLSGAQAFDDGFGCLFGSSDEPESTVATSQIDF